MDYLLKRKGQYYFNRRVPGEYKDFDDRKFVRFSLKTDSLKEAIKRSHNENQLLERFWSGLVIGGHKRDHVSYEESIKLARLLGVIYKPSTELASAPIQQVIERLLEANNRINDGQVVNALLGGTPLPKLKLDEVLAKYFHYTKGEIWNKSENQIRKWQNPRKLAMRTFVECVGNKDFDNLNKDDVIKYRDWWLMRVDSENKDSKTANKNLIQVKSIIETVNQHMSLGLDIDRLFRKITLKTGEDTKRHPFDTNYITTILLNPDNLKGLNEQAKWVLHAFAETGAGVSELVGLMPDNIHLDCDIPYIEIMPQKRKSLKTKYRKRTIPIVGYALDAFQACPTGFTEYRDRPDSLSGTLSKYLKENGLMPTDQHTVYSLRHSFQDRLLAANAPDRVQADLMGHKFNRQSYGNGASLEQKREWLEQIKLKRMNSFNLYNQVAQ